MNLRKAMFDSCMNNNIISAGHLFEEIDNDPIASFYYYCATGNLKEVERCIEKKTFEYEIGMNIAGNCDQKKVISLLKKTRPSNLDQQMLDACLDKDLEKAKELFDIAHHGENVRFYYFCAIGALKPIECCILHIKDIKVNEGLRVAKLYNQVKVIEMLEKCN